MNIFWVLLALAWFLKGCWALDQRKSFWDVAAPFFLLSLFNVSLGLGILQFRG